jgi:O-antigen ligase
MREYVELLKYVLLFFLIWGAIDDKDDIRTSLCAIALGAAYIGYEVTINNRGHFTHSRLEGVGAPAADTANGLASLLLAVLPMTGVLFLNGKARHKAVLFACAPLILNVIVMCNSRGAFLGLIAAGLTFVLLARGASRKKAIQVFALAGVLLYLLLGDPKIFNRFVTTFSGSEERDNSASSRLVYWRAGLRMLEDYPLGAGGGGFKWVHAQQYLEAVGSDEDARALHNGYLTEATDWGVQGLLLKLLLVGAAVAAAHRTSKRCRLEGRDNDALIGIALIAATSGFMVCCVFGSFLGNEWCYWQLAYLVRYAELYGVAEAEATSEVVPQEVPRLRALARGA